MLIASRADNSWLGRWWFSVDRWLLGALMILICIGFYLVAAASPAVAIRIGAPPFHFIYNHLFVQSLGIIGMIAVSTFPPKRVRLLAILATVGILALLIMVPIIGEEIKGARRWIHLPGFSLQPSEFIKPSLAVVMAWLFARAIDVPGFRGRVIGIALYGVTVLLLLLQPDFGMTFLVTAIFGVQFFMTGIPYWLVAGLIILLICGGIAGYFMFPHFNARINKFMSPETTESYQIDRSLEAFHHGGLLGTGPGQGKVKFHIPDAHADFVFSVAGEELGLIWTLVIAGLFAFILGRGFMLALNSRDLFTTLALAGLLTQLGLQAMIHMASTLSLIPTKGMTLPFLSYGGSSTLALSYGMGMVLALTRRGSAREDK